MLSQARSVSNATDLAYPEIEAINKRNSESSYSTSDDDLCGEALLSQHLCIDFRPLEDVDTDFIQRKCCAFWEFLDSREELKHLMVNPEISTFNSELSSNEISPKPLTNRSDDETAKLRTAVSMLEIVENKGLIDRIFEAKLPQSMCTLGSREYHENEVLAPGKVTTRKKKIKACTCRGVCKTCKQKSIDSPPSPGSPKVKDLVNKMQEWDEKHPKNGFKMIRLPERPRGSKKTEDLCKCHPICKSRRREWKGKIQNTSAELLLERKPLAECFRRWPTKVYPNSPCPFFGRTKRVIVKEENRPSATRTVRICQAPVDDTVDTPYLKYAELAKQIGAWDAVRAYCAFCKCGACCPCGIREYILYDEERSAHRNDMRQFDTRVKHDYTKMRIMYDKI